MDQTFNSQEFLLSLAEELIANFDRAGRATTPGLVGSAREHELRKKLESILPGSVGVSSGCVIDSYGGTSNQADVVLYEKTHCPIFSINNDPAATYFPCESVMAVGEIKSSLGTKELNDAVDKIAKIKSLQRHLVNPTCFRKYGSAMGLQGTEEEVFDPINKPLDQVYGFIFCHDFSLAQKTLAERFITACNRHEPHLAPNALISLNSGMLMFSNGNQVTENKIGANSVCTFNNPDGEFPFLLHKLTSVANNGRTTENLPYSRYILKSQNTANAEATFYPLA